MINENDIPFDYRKYMRVPMNDKTNEKTIEDLNNLEPGKIEIVSSGGCECWNSQESKFIDDDVREEFKDKQHCYNDPINLQLIKELKQLNRYIFESTKE